MRSCGADCPYQLCGRRTFYQLLVCDNTMETDIGAPYYSDQQLFPGFMMAEYDGTNTPPHSALCTLHSTPPPSLLSPCIFLCSCSCCSKMCLYAIAAELNCTTECALSQANAG